MSKVSREAEHPQAYPHASFKAPLGASRLSPLSRGSASPLSAALGLDRPPKAAKPARGRRRLLIIARDRVAFYEAVKQELAGRTDIEVILDRRREPRRQLPGPRVLERRGLERRTRSGVDAIIRRTGWAVVYLDE